MSSSPKPRLYKPPENTLDVLKAVISGNKSKEQIAEELGVTPKTAVTKIHDPLYLGLIEKEGDEYEATDEARRIVQLGDEGVLEERCVDLPGVAEVLDRLENGGATLRKLAGLLALKLNLGPQKKRHSGNMGQSMLGGFTVLILAELRKQPHNPSILWKVIVERTIPVSLRRKSSRRCVLWTRSILAQSWPTGSITRNDIRRKYSPRRTHLRSRKLSVGAGSPRRKRVAR